MNKSETLEFDKIYTTFDYSKFNQLSYNREVNNIHVKQLAVDIEKNGLILPLTVDRDFNIIDGQHRFLACRELGRPIKYHLVETDVDVALTTLNNVRRSWKLSNWIDYWADKGKVDYCNVRQYSKTSGIPITLTCEIFSPTKSGSTRTIKSGYYVMTNQSIKTGKMIVKTINLCEEIIGLEAKKRAFIRAIKEVVMRNDNFIPERLVTSMKANPFSVYAKTDDTADAIVTSYNYRLKLDSNKIS